MNRAPIAEIARTPEDRVAEADFTMSQARTAYNEAHKELREFRESGVVDDGRYRALVRALNEASAAFEEAREVHIWLKHELGFMRQPYESEAVKRGIPAQRKS